MYLTLGGGGGGGGVGSHYGVVIYNLYHCRREIWSAFLDIA